jgi:hypothetical protein
MSKKKIVIVCSAAVVVLLAVGYGILKAYVSVKKDQEWASVYQRGVILDEQVGQAK